MTETEKNTVVEFVRDLLFNNLNTEFTNAEIRERIQEKLGYSIAPATLGSVITKRIAYNMPTSYLFMKERGKYMVTTEKFYRLVKEKSQIFLCDEEGNLELIWDYNNLNFKIERKENNEIYEKVKIDDKEYRKDIVKERISRVPEWVFSYPSILKEIFALSIYGIVTRLPKKLNKLDIELVNSFSIDNEIIHTWVERLAFIHKFTNDNNSLVFKGLNKNAFHILQSSENRWECLGIKEAINLLNLTKKLAICSVKNFEEYSYYDTFCGLIEMKKHEWLPYLDTNRTFEQNNKIFEEYKDREENNIISKNLKKLNFLNNYQIENYIICVPQDKNDLIKEGKAQNNCVGHYYNNSIMKGENLIYFIRNKDNPTKSFVTCRYNLTDKLTVEHRTKNNKWYGNANLLNAIDKLINENI